MSGSQGLFYKNKVKPEIAVYIETNYPDFFEQVLKLAGEEPASGSVAAAWSSGFATSGNPGADLITIGAEDVRYKVHSLLVSIVNLSPGASIEVRLYQELNGVEHEVYNQSFVPGTDPDGLWIINGTVSIHQELRVELYSNDPADDGAAVDYDYMLEAM